MNPRIPINDEPNPIAQVAAEWTLRHDRGLTASEQDEFSLWLAADPRHRVAWAEHRWGWDELDRLAGLQTSVHAVPDPNLLVRRDSFGAGMHGTRRYLYGALALVAILALGFFNVWLPRRSAPSSRVASLTPRALALIEQRELTDGSVIALNRGAVATSQFTAGERRVRLDRGEAHFQVAHDAARPFVVEAGGVAVRAVGTAFNVRLESASVEVLVTEGKVSVAPAEVNGALSSHAMSLPVLEAGNRTVVSFAPAAPAPQVTAGPPAEIEARLAWQPRLRTMSKASCGCWSLISACTPNGAAMTKSSCSRRAASPGSGRLVGPWPRSGINFRRNNIFFHGKRRAGVRSIEPLTP
ncbi:MAG: FecR domain-containing protein [Opitutae bacterium]|nr:FecR domain-containing protein [Opitutae bacterium]